MRSSDAARGRAGDGDEEGEKVEERDTGEGEILTPELEDFLRSSEAARGRAGDGDEEGGEDEDGAQVKKMKKKKGMGSAARRAEKRKREGDEGQGRN